MTDPEEFSWFQPTVLEFRRGRNSDKITVKVCWASPGELEKAPLHQEFRVEIADVGSAKPACDSGADLGATAAAAAASASKKCQWKESLCTQDQVADLHLDPSRRYLVRINPSERCRMLTKDALGLFETPNWPAASLEDIILTSSSTPLVESSPKDHMAKDHKLVSPAVPSTPPAFSPAGRTSHSTGSRLPKTIPGPLFLRELTAYDGERRLFCGAFEWLPQTYFDANILDLQLVEPGDSSEPHDFVMVYAGAEHQVRVHNILPGSSYRVRLRAGDFVDGELSTVVERATLPFVTPPWSELATSGRAGQEAGARLQSPEVSCPCERPFDFVVVRHRLTWTNRLQNCCRHLFSTWKKTS